MVETLIEGCRLDMLLSYELSIFVMIVDIVSAIDVHAVGAVPLRHYHIVCIIFPNYITLKHIILATYTHNVPV